MVEYVLSKAIDAYDTWFCSDPDSIPNKTLDPLHPTLIIPKPNIRGRRRDELFTCGRVYQARYDYDQLGLEQCITQQEEKIGKRNNKGDIRIDEDKRWNVADFGFLVHPRNVIPENYNQTGEIPDTARQYPLFKHFSNNKDKFEEEITKLPLVCRAAQITGLIDKDGKELNGYVLIGTIYPEFLRINHDALKIAQERALLLSVYGYMLGMNRVGLGGLLGMITHLGVDIKGKIPQLDVTTGHSATTVLIRDTVFDAANRTNLKLEDSTVAVVGGLGSIGSNSTYLLAPHVKEIMLFDRKLKKGVASEFIKGQYNRPGKIAQMSFYGVSQSEDDTQTSPYNYLNKADIIICAAAAAEPFIRGEWLKKGVIIIDDAAPRNVAPGVAERRDGVSLDVVASGPKGYIDHFDYGLYKGSFFGCEAEVSALTAQRLPGFTGDVTSESLKVVERALHETGFKLGPPQRDGTLISRSTFERIKLLRLSNKAA